MPAQHTASHRNHTLTLSVDDDGRAVADLDGRPVADFGKIKRVIRVNRESAYQGMPAALSAAVVYDFPADHMPEQDANGWIHVDPKTGEVKVGGFGHNGARAITVL
jgi:hypothetical protein